MKKTNRSSHDELNLTNYLAMKNILYCLNNTVKCHFPLLCWCSLKILIGTLIPILTTILPKIVIEMITAKQSVYKLAFLRPDSQLYGQPCHSIRCRQISD